MFIQNTRSRAVTGAPSDQRYFLRLTVTFLPSFENTGG